MLHNLSACTNTTTPGSWDDYVRTLHAILSPCLDLKHIGHFTDRTADSFHLISDLGRLADTGSWQEHSNPKICHVMWACKKMRAFRGKPIWRCLPPLVYSVILFLLLPNNLQCSAVVSNFHSSILEIYLRMSWMDRKVGRWAFSIFNAPSCRREGRFYLSPIDPSDETWRILYTAKCMYAGYYSLHK